MAFQLIYTSSAHLLDSPLSGYGVVARSEQIPASLVSELVELSIYRPATDQAIEGAQFSYTVLENDERTWHVLTATRPAGDDHTRRPCHIAHHIVLPDSEAQVYATPGTGGPPSTPAGILLALELVKFWARHWRREPAIIDDSDFPLPIDCPSVEGQPTWRIFSGNSKNAALLGSDACSRSCLLLVPEGTGSRDILRLLHEGSALAPQLGWGKPFSTHSTVSDLVAGCLGFSTHGSPVHRHSLPGKMPIIEILPSLMADVPVATSTPALSPIPAVPSTKAEEPLQPRKPVLHSAASSPASARRRKRSRTSNLEWCLAGVAILLAAGALALCTDASPANKPLPAEPPTHHVDNPTLP